MLEIVVVLVILFIVSAVVISRYTTAGANELLVETEALKANLRYAQIKAMSDTLQPNNRPRWGVDFPNTTSYTLYRLADDGTKVYVNLPGEVLPSPTRTLYSGVSINSLADATVAFDDWGSPFDGSGNAWTLTKSIILTQGTETSKITITKNTGFIP